ncbi:unnamed protein product [Rotaria sp. Silwood2]|nr:unnamed protein product [Rotaria sp. Silwood2]
MVQHCVNAASTDFCSYNSKTQRDAIDVVGNFFFCKSKSSSINNAVDYHIHTLGSMQAGTVDFISNVLPAEIRSSSSILTEQIPSDLISSYKTNTTTSSTSSSGYESVLSCSSKSRKSLFYRLKRLINFSSTKKSVDYPLPTINNYSEQNNLNSPILSFRNPIISSKINNTNETRRNSLTRLDIKRKSSRRTLSPATQHIPFLYGLKNCGNTW